jgi:streptomycin 6-kinase
LFEVQFAPNCSPQGRIAIQKAKRLAQELLSAPEDICFLHGDLHHDNIRKAARGYCAFDAKGVMGERAFELANAFRNPKGAAPLIRDPNRVRFLRELWSREFVVPPLRLMQWACVKTALSVCWRSGPVLFDDPEFDLLEIFFGVLEETS